jgi:hypothetical protein
MTKPSVPEWLRFKDRGEWPYNPVQHDQIITNRFFSNTRSDGANDVGSRTEEWSIASALVPKRQLARSAAKVFHDDLPLSLGWDSATRFAFGDVDKVRGIDLHSWVVTREELVTGKLIVELRQDFIRYHALHERASPHFSPSLS